MVEHPFNVLSLCTGGLGLDRGIGLAVPSARTVCMVEREGFACGKLVEGMAAKTVDACPIWSDARTFDGRPWRGVVDCIIGGYPCQPFSFAGKRAGADDPRHLWPVIRRIVEEVEPGVVFFENVAGHLTLGFPAVRRELEALGYRVTAGLFTASEVGAPHKRERLFILGCLDHAGGADGKRHAGAVLGAQAGIGGAGKLNGHRAERPEHAGAAVDNPAGPRHEPARCGQPGESGGGQCVPGLGCDELAHAPRARGGELHEPEGRHDAADADGQGDGLAHAASGGLGIGGEPPERDRQPDGGDETLDDAQRAEPRQGEQGEQGEAGSGRRGLADAGGSVADAGQPGSQGRERREPHGAVNGIAASGSTAELRRPLFPPGPGELDRWREVLAHDPTLEPALCPVAHGLADRRDWLRLGGNGVVPLAAAYAFCTLAACLEGEHVMSQDDLIWSMIQ